MVVVHKVFRRELALIPRLVRAVAPGDTRRAAVVAGHARLVLGGLDMHHTGEDALLWPKLLERDAPDSELIHRMEAQHHRVEELIAGSPMRCRAGRPRLARPSARRWRRPSQLWDSWMRFPLGSSITEERGFHS